MTAKPNTESDKSIDEWMVDLQYSDSLGTVERHNKRIEAKDRLYSLLMGVIGNVDLLEFWNSLDDHFSTELLTDEHAEHIRGSIERAYTRKFAKLFNKEETE